MNIGKNKIYSKQNSIRHNSTNPLKDLVNCAASGAKKIRQLTLSVCAADYCIHKFLDFVNFRQLRISEKCTAARHI